MLPRRSTRHRGRRERRQQRQAAWMFLLACVILFASMILFGPDELRPMQHRALGVTSSILVGFLAYFFCGSLKGVAESDRSGYAKVGICLVAAVIAAVIAFGLWEIGLAPVPRSAG